MANSPPNTELDEQIRVVDALTSSPSDRANRVWHLLETHDPDLTTWDVLCFCAEFVGLIAERYHWILPIAKRFTGLVYTAHYYGEDRTNAESDRIARKVELVDTSDRPNASPKSLFDRAGVDAPSVGVGRSNTSTKAPIYIRNSASDPSTKSSPSNAGPGERGDVGKPT